MNRVFSRRRLGEDRLSRVVRLAASILFAAGLARGIFAVGADTISPSQKFITRAHCLNSPPTQACTVTPVDSEVRSIFKTGRNSSRKQRSARRKCRHRQHQRLYGELVDRKRCDRLPLDVSTSNSFSSYVNGLSRPGCGQRNWAGCDRTEPGHDLLLPRACL